MKMESNEKLPQSSSARRQRVEHLHLYGLLQAACCTLPSCPVYLLCTSVGAGGRQAEALNCLGPQAQLVAQVHIYLFIYCERNAYQQIAIIVVVVVACSWQSIAGRGGEREKLHL